MKLPVGLQVYTVRDHAERDFAGTMKKIAEIGYKYVELAGLYGLEPSAVKSALDEAGLVAISAHVPFDELSGDTDKVLDIYKSLGCEYVAVPYLSDEYRPGAEKFEFALSEIARIGKACAERGMLLLYHNHDFEFVTMPDGSFGLDYMYSHIPAEHLATELDTCWVRVAGQDPAAYVRKYTGRAPIVHLKDYVGEKTEGMYDLIGQEKTSVQTNKFEFRPVGSGIQNIPSILDAAVDAGAKYVVVEQDQTYDMASLEAAKRSFDYLASLK